MLQKSRLKTEARQAKVATSAAKTAARAAAKKQATTAGNYVQPPTMTWAALFVAALCMPGSKSSSTQPAIQDLTSDSIIDLCVKAFALPKAGNKAKSCFCCCQTHRNCHLACGPLPPVNIPSAASQPAPPPHIPEIEFESAIFRNVSRDWWHA